MGDAKEKIGLRLEPKKYEAPAIEDFDQIHKVTQERIRDSWRHLSGLAKQTSSK